MIQCFCGQRVFWKKRGSGLFPNVSWGFNFADDCEADISRDFVDFRGFGQNPRNLIPAKFNPIKVPYVCFECGQGK